MPIDSPPIAGPPYQDVAGRAERIAETVSDWKPPAEGQVDLGRALIRTFDRMARHVIERLNQIPDRSFLSFLNLIGTEPTPARQARVPLTFTLVEGGDAEPTVPAGTRVGAVPEPDDTREIVFETEQGLTATRARLVSALARQPDGDRWADRTELATGVRPDFYAAFGGDQPMEHAAFISLDDLQGLPSGAKMALTLTFSSPADAQSWGAFHAPTAPPLAADAYYESHPPAPPLVRWSYWNGAAWGDLAFQATLSGTDWRLDFTCPADLTALDLGGRSARWLRARLVAWPKAPIPAIAGVRLSAAVTRSGLAPDLALYAGQPVDLSMDFAPLGDRPRLNDTFYVASAEVLSRPGATVTVTVEPSSQALPLKASDSPRLAWEVSTASGWAQVVTPDTGPTTTSSDPAASIPNDALRTMTFTLPQDVGPAEVVGERTSWLRIRLVGGSYGRGIVIDKNAITDDGYRPPVLKKLTLGYTATLQATVSTCLTSNDLILTEQTGSNRWIPFVRSAEQRLTLYLGFDRPFAPVDTHLYLQVAPLSVEESLRPVSRATPPKIVWAYSTASGWAPLGAADETRAFARSGLLQFIGPGDFSARTELGQTLYWLRAQWVEGTFPVMPRLGLILTNTVWATHSTTLTDEELGSSDGLPDQTFTLSNQPVLDGQKIEVREASQPSAAERAEIERLEGGDAIRLVGDPASPDEIWVRWHEVPDFHASGPTDRHYVIDRETGEVRFGGEQRGMAPPPGVRSIRAAYRTGGGVAGNRAARKVTELKTTVAYVDGVTNLEPATGGADREDLKDVKERGPRLLRHGGRAVTVEDFEDLAHEASAGVARVKALTATADPIYLAESLVMPANAGSVTMLIVPHSSDARPTPSLGLLQDVDAYLRQRCPPAVSLSVVGPSWSRVDTTVTVVPSSIEAIEALRGQMQRAIADYLHPLTGGLDGTGWDFGAFPTESDLYRLLVSFPGVASTRTVSLTLPDLSPEQAARTLIFSGTHTINFVSQGES